MKQMVLVIQLMGAYPHEPCDVAEECYYVEDTLWLETYEHDKCLKVAMSLRGRYRVGSFSIWCHAVGD
jgi:hypothetical protein